MKYRRREYIGIAGVFLLILFITGLVIFLLNNIKVDINEALNDRQRKIKLISKFRDEYIDHYQKLNYLINSPEEPNSTIISEFEAFTKKEALLLDSLERLIVSKDSKQLLDEITNLYHAYIEIEQQTLSLLNKQSAASQLLNSKSRQINIKLFESLESLQGLQENLMNEALERIQTSRINVIIAVVIALIGMLLVFAFLLNLIRRTTFKLKEVAGIMRNAPYDSGEALPRIDIISDDEIGSIAGIFNEMADALEQKSEQLLAHSQSKSDFLTTVSHELRTPLNSIINLAQMLAEDTSPTDSEFAAIIYTSGIDLLNLVNDLLDLSAASSGSLKANIQQVNLHELPLNLEQYYLPAAQQKEIEFSITQEENLPDVIYSDGRLLEKILTNLLSNAFKFTLKGRVELSLRYAEEQEVLVHLPIHHPMLALSVTDTGIGIPQEKQESIFHIFHQGDGSISRKYSGTGTGLALSKELAHLLGGFIKVESIEGQGSKFTVYIPYKGANEILEG